MNFQKVILTVFRKSAKSLQIVLNELTELIPIVGGVTAGAYSRARHKFRHTAFIELSKDCIIKPFYQEDIKRHLGFRLLAIDGSLVRVPDTETTREAFGTTKIIDALSKKTVFVQTRCSVLYDVENNLCLDGLIAPRKTHERELAKIHLENTKNGDLLLLDRGYPGYEFLSAVVDTGADFLARCSGVFSKTFDFSKSSDITVKLKKPYRYREDNSLPLMQEFRALKIKLSTGEDEILVTSLLSKKLYPKDIFKELYYKRWGVETFYKIMKSRLALENFTGTSAEAVRQDFFATILITNLETIFTADVNQELENKNTDLQQQVNKNISFNVIKNKAFELFDSNEDIDTILAEMEELFRQTPTVVRPDRIHPKRHHECNRGRDPKIYHHRAKHKINF